MAQKNKYTDFDQPPTLVFGHTFKRAARTETGVLYSCCFTCSHSSGVCLFVGCLTSQQHASVSQGRICTDNLTCCHTEIEVADPTFYLTQSQCTDTGPTGPSADSITPGVWQGSHWSANFEVTGMTRPRKKSQRKWDSNPGSSALEADALPQGQRGGWSIILLLFHPLSQQRGKFPLGLQD